jgi:hypothetical protein
MEITAAYDTIVAGLHQSSLAYSRLPGDASFLCGVGLVSNSRLSLLSPAAPGVCCMGVFLITIVHLLSSGVTIPRHLEGGPTVAPVTSLALC